MKENLINLRSFNHLFDNFYFDFKKFLISALILTDYPLLNVKELQKLSPY